ncbi:MAG: ABC transporter permease subunit [Ardenticatenaceae bacterium]|nr:ABC transporter permease subunit [Ardenticatenaceae bacterium]
MIHSKSTTWPRWLIPSLILLLIVIFLIIHVGNFPESWNLHLRDPLNEFKRWIVINRKTHWMFLYFFEPLSATLDFIIRRAEDLLLWLPWPVIIAAVFLIANRISGLRLGLLTTACLLLMGLFGLWDESMATLALMVIAVLLSLLMGIPLGIWTARNDRAERFLRPILDAMQTMPAFVYLIPVLLFFGVARVPSVIATIVYALPPVIRLTSLGIRSVSEEAIEAARAFGVTERQLLWKVQVPMAMPSILAGINQSIMMALSIVIIAALIGSGGLGDAVLKALRRLRVGEALEAGLAIVVMAILLDRLSAAFTQMERHSQKQFQGFRLFSNTQQGQPLVERMEGGITAVYTRAHTFSTKLTHLILPQFAAYSYLIGSLALLLILLLLGLLFGMDSFPRSWNLNISTPVDALVDWMQINLVEIGDTGLGTGPFRDFLIIYLFQPLVAFFTQTLSWPVLFLLFVWAGLATGRWRLALTVFASLFAIGLFGMWEFAVQTLVQVLLAVVVCMGLGIPLGIWAAHNDRVDSIMRVVNDTLQTIPIFVYLVPVIMLFRGQEPAGVIAAILYSLPPVVRLTSLGIRQVDDVMLESAVSFGATSWQKLLKVEVPLALPSIMLGINQTIMMVLAMVIIAGFVGAAGLGFEVVFGFTNDNLGRSVEAGLAIVLLAIVIDRITQAWAQRAAQSANLS